MIPDSTSKNFTDSEVSSNFTLHLIKVGKSETIQESFKRLENHPYDRLS